jgi:UDP-N-acetylglucosamine--N-acetylmuramyl-(pentapeptide) pyrophosphoryl-undecaprenol N-acetylglucosamine transferase
VYGIAHLVVARAGAMTLSEIAVCGLPSILVPYPHAMDDHQTGNARTLAEKDAAVLLPDRELDGERLATEVRRLLSDSKRLRAMAQSVFILSRPDSARRLAEAVERLGGGAPQSVLHLPEDYDPEEAAAKSSARGGN